ncbi:outer membrane biogenesis protein BamB [Anatilimnocola aggregata]|uniref:Outer membrane biogenesis protein BamB n=1 Tax=Anatilimnocola aggregata TaxID=2528021 RepID=A0A517YCZ9_9BACT|nr:PQQ-binding-like beta-propeller repeat protein [Anatilimnocola aggregata]QDU28111.1 outer membrane biogenesis protein BamB [Anatilimnocola aggregata]
MTKSAWLLLLLTCTAPIQGADWTTYRGDAERSGYTAESLPAKLSLAWTYQPKHSPTPAWPRDDRMLFDRASDVVVSGGVALFGSSTDCQVIALDAKTGQRRWTFFTDAPVRFAPAIWRDRAFVVSDDGHLYCLSIVDGTLLQKWRGGPSDDLILGNGRMVSRWPARGGPVVRDNIVYYAAGIWQSEGIFLYAIDAETGKVLWHNDEAGKIYMPQPHGGAMANSGVSAQGYLVATNDELIVPTGRAVPAGFARRSGSFLYYHLQANGHIGGTQTVVAGSRFYNGGTAFQNATGALVAKLGLGMVAATPAGTVFGTKKDVRLVKLVEKTAPDRKGVPTKSLDHEVQWSVADVDGSASLIVAGNVIVAGGGTSVTAIDAKSQAILWSAEVDGVPYGLAAANGCLYVSTDRGTVYCFADTVTSPPAKIAPAKSKPIAAQLAGDAADEIIKRTGVKDGFCLDLDCGNADLAIALAQRTQLQIYALTSAESEVNALRTKLAAHGLYGSRITVHLGNAETARYGKYFADLVVSSASLNSGSLGTSLEKLPREVRPAGGMLCTGKLGAMEVATRPALAKAGSWTHQYSDLGNSSCSTDEIVKGDLKALWFRDVDLEMPQRHGRGHAPLFQDGRMFVEGMGALRAVDAYNGRNLWEFPLPNIQAAYNADHLSGTSVTGSNFCVAAGSVFVHDKLQCYRLDAVTGKKLGEFKPPAQRDGKPGSWGYIACDGKLLFGSLANPKHVARFAWKAADVSELWGESATFFALDAKTGELRWRYDAEESIRHNAIAIGNGRVFLIDRAIANEDRWNPADKSAKLPAVTALKQPLGRLVALDSSTGEIVWKGERDAFGTMLALSPQHDALVMGYQSTRFKLPSEIGGKLAVIRASTGQEMWKKDAKYVTRPLINDRIIYTQGEAWDLLTGKEQGFALNRSYGCGQLAGSKHMLLFRSATLGYLDLSRGSGVENYGGIRPGCWINALPVGGLVLVPDASAGCQCSYQNRSWMALSGTHEE